MLCFALFFVFLFSRGETQTILDCDSRDILIAQRDAMIDLMNLARMNNPLWNYRQWGNLSAVCNITSYNSLGVLVSVPSPPEAPQCCWEGIQVGSVAACGRQLNLTLVPPPQCCAGLGASTSTCDRGSVNCCPLQLIPGCNCLSRGLITELDLTASSLSVDIGQLLNSTFQNVSCSLFKFMAPFNFINGSFPSPSNRTVPLYQKFTNLTEISLNTNKIQGTLPVELGSIPRLMILDLRDNQMTGIIPPSLCGSESRISPLVDLLLSRNKFTGRFDLEYCDALVMLDVRSNNLTAWGDMNGFPFLHILRASYNFHLSGSLPKGLGDSGQLVDWSAMSSNMTGTIPDYFANMTLLQQINFNNNGLTGTLPEIFFERATLYSVNLVSNNLNGTIPPSIGFSPLSLLDLNNNNFYGTIPWTMALLAQGRIAVDLSSNNLFCCGTNWTGSTGNNISDGNYSYAGINPTARLLPPFLQMSLQNLVYYPPDANFFSYPGYFSWGSMRCPSLYYAQNLKNHTYSIFNVSSLQNITAPPLVIHGASPFDALPWVIDPQYYRYYGCVCENGFNMQTIDLPNFVNFPVQACIADTATSWLSQNMWVISFMVAGGVLLFLAIFWFVCLGPGTRPNFFIAIENAKKRMKREPTVGDTVSIVNTDIEGYSNYMKKFPELMTKALNTHNAVIRHCRWAAFGGTIEQEGDSYTLYFYDPFDAAFFCLMSQQRLMKQTWDPELFDEVVLDGVVRPTRGSRALSYIKSSLNSLLKNKSFLAGSSPKVMRVPSDRSIKQLGARKGSMLKPKPSMALSTGPGPFLAGSATESDRGSMSGIVAEDPLVSAAFKGPRVRMGIATGTLDVIPINASSVMESAKTVADAGAGGQLLMDQATFDAIKDRLEELAAVDHEGLNVDQLSKMKPSLWVQFVRYCRGNKGARELEALVLDMGEYVYSKKKLPAVNVPSPVTKPHNPNQSFAFAPDEDSSHQGSLGSNRPIGSVESGGSPAVVNSPVALAGATSTSSSLQGAPKTLHLYQILAPTLVARGKKFANTLALKEEWRCTNRPYFCAPGTLEAPLGPLDVSLPIPSITMVFCMVEGGKAFAAKSRGDAKIVHEALSTVISDTLKEFPGGYLCRKQDGDLKYMLAFDSPCAALAWCLVMQEAAMYADWSDSTLLHFKEQYESRRLVFRGPRLKMGVCDGLPKTIIPDHLGRADYHGASVNQAARYMDAAAHGGQIACEASLIALAIEEFSTTIDNMKATKQQQKDANAASQSAVAGSSENHHLASPSPVSRADEDEVSLSFPPPSGHSTTTLSRVSEEPPKDDQEEEIKPASSQVTGPSPKRFSSGKKMAVGVIARGISGSGASSSIAGSPQTAAVAGPSTSSPAAANEPPAPIFKRLSYLAIPHEPTKKSDEEEEDAPYIGRALAVRIGDYKFKGNPESIEMVYLVNESAERRTFPLEPPKGKGNRVREASGLYSSFELVLPLTAVRYKEEYLKRRAAEGIRDDDSAEGDSGKASPLQRVGTMLSRAFSKRSISDTSPHNKSGRMAEPDAGVASLKSSGWRGVKALTAAGMFRFSPAKAAPPQPSTHIEV